MHKTRIQTLILKAQKHPNIHFLTSDIRLIENYCHSLTPQYLDTLQNGQMEIPETFQAAHKVFQNKENPLISDFICYKKQVLRSAAIVFCGLITAKPRNLKKLKVIHALVFLITGILITAGKNVSMCLFTCSLTSGGHLLKYLLTTICYHRALIHRQKCIF